MTWFRNHYECYRCDHEWTDEWSCACDDECPSCGARHASPVDSDDLTITIDEEDGEYVVRRSPPSAEHNPDYEEVVRFLAETHALAYAELVLGP